MAKVKYESYYLASTSGSGHFYTKRRPQKKGKGGGTKLEVLKFDPFEGTHVKYVEKKDPPKRDKGYKPKVKQPEAA